MVRTEKGNEVFMMKKFLSLAICSALLLCACSDEKIVEEALKETEDTTPVTTIVIETDISEETEETEEAVDLSDMDIINSNIPGGWEYADDPSITDERLQLFEDAMGTYVGVDYEPVCYLASQLVAGTNHCFLCRTSAVVPDPVPYWTLVYIYKDLQGNATVTQIAILGYDLGADDNGMAVTGVIPSGDGEWTVPDDPTITDEQNAVIDDMYEHVAFELVDDFVACLGVREDNGYEYCFLSQVSMPGATEPLGWQLVYISTDTNGAFADVRTGVIDIGMLSS